MSKEFVLSREQELAIEYNKPAAYAIKGIAGSGKTTVGIHRIPFLLRKCTDENDRMLVVTFHKTLVNYLEHLVKEQMLQYSTELNFSKSNWAEKLEVISIDDLMDGYYKKYCLSDDAKKRNFRFREEVSSQTEIQVIFITALNDIKTKYSDETIFNDSNIDFLLEEVQYLISNRIESLQFYQGYTRKGRNRFRDQRLNFRKKSRTRKAIFELKNKYVRLLLENGKLDRFVKRRLALINIEENPPKNITHLIVDEAQDLDRVRFDFLKQFSDDKKDYSSATFLYDPKQSVHAHSWLGNGHTFRDLGIDIKNRSRSLNKNFRTTYEIQKAAVSVLRKEKRDIDIELTNHSGVKPLLIESSKKSEQKNVVINILKTLKEQLTLKDIIIAGKDIDTLLDLEREINKTGIDCTFIYPRDKSFGYNKVRLMTLYATKGLECEAMIIVDANEGVIPGNISSEANLSRDRKLMYVSMIRATRYLYIITSGETSSFINEIEENTISIINHTDIILFKPVADPKIKIAIEKLGKDISIKYNQIEKVENRGLNSFEDFQEMSSEINNLNFGMKSLHEQMKDISNAIDSKTFLYKSLSKEITEQEEKVKRIGEDVIKKIGNPVSMNKIKKDIKDKYTNFSDDLIKTLVTSKYNFLRGKISGDKDSIDWGAELVLFSKAFENVIKIYYQKINKSLYKDNIKHKKELYLLIEELYLMKVITSEQKRVLGKYKKKRNDGTHEMSIGFKELKIADEIFFGNGGLFEKINKLL